MVVPGSAVDPNGTILLSGATENQNHWEIARSNANDVTPICDWESNRAQLALGARDGVILSPVSQSNTNQSWMSVSPCMQKSVDSVFFSKCSAAL